MCLGTPGQIVELAEDDRQFGRVAVAGTVRPVYLGMLEPAAVQVGAWVLVNAGMAISPLEAEEASLLQQTIEAFEQQIQEEWT